MGALANGALILGVVLGPGYLFVRTVARDIPIRSQTELEDLVQMLIVGVLAGLLSGFLLYGIGEIYSRIDFFGFLEQGGENYFTDEPGWSIATIALFLFFGYVTAFAAAVAYRHYMFLQMRKPGNRTSNGSVLYGLMIGSEASVVSVATTFGKIFVGEVIGYSRTSKSDRELALGGPHLHFVNDRGSGQKNYLPGTVLIRESQIEYIFLFDDDRPDGLAATDQPEG